MKRLAFSLAASLLIAALTLFCIEGIYSVARWKRADRSIVYGVYASLRDTLEAGASPPAQSGLPLAGRDEIESLIPEMIEAGVGMGNVPYKELVTDRAAINAVGPDGCRSPKPAIRKTTTYLRSGDYDRFDPPSLFYDKDAPLGERLERFLDTYAVRRADFTTNSAAERTTVPSVDSSQKILVAGDSVAVGSMIDDTETLSSHLQRDDASVQYVNLGVNGASAEDVVCRLSKAAERYEGAISGLIYVYCENDLDPQLPYGQPDQVIAWLKDFAQREGIPRVTVVFAPYIYNIVPHLTRFGGSRGARHGFYTSEAARLKTDALAAGFDFVSIADVALEEAKRRGTDFAVFSLFVDHVHLSDYGVSLLAKKLPAR